MEDGVVEKVFDGVIGIDLGTTYSCVAVFLNGRVEVLENDQGNRTTPSIVGFTNSEMLIGESAKNQMTINPENTIFDAKRLVGRRFQDTEVQSDIPHWPFKVSERQNDSRPMIHVTYRGEDREYSPEFISAMVLTKMKQTAERKLGQRVTKAVITVPAYFSDAQRQATKDAGNIAGLEVLRIINEPTAAALAFGLGRDSSKPITILVFDLGGGTFDVSLLRIEDGVFEVKATAGDTHLGGEDFDSRVVEQFVSDFRRKFQCEKDVTQNKKAMRKLRSHAERVKRTLSSTAHTDVEIDSLHEGNDYHTTVTREHFEDICLDLFESVLEPVEQVLLDSGIPREDVDEVVMVGGSTRIPKIREIVQNFFATKEVSFAVNADEAVAYGAAIQASILSELPEQESDETENIVLLDVTPLSLGIRTHGDIMSVVIPRNTTIPTKQSRIYSTDRDSQETVNIQIYEGERRFTTGNRLLGNFRLTNIPPMPKGTPKIHVEFELDADGILTVLAQEESSGIKSKITIHHDRNRLSEKEIIRMVEIAKEYEEDDVKNQERIQTRNKLADQCYRLGKKVQSHRGLPPLRKEEYLQMVEAVQIWVDKKRDADKEEFVAKSEALSQIALQLDAEQI